MWLVAFISIATITNIYSPSYYKSIHQFESERYVDMIEPAGTSEHDEPLVPQKNLTHEVMGFLPYWMDDNIDLHWDLLSTVAWFSVEARIDGGINNLYGWPPSGLISTAHANGTRVVLTVTCFSSSTISAILSNPTTRQILAQNLLNEVQYAGADGVCIDFEGVYGSQRDNLVAFMQELSELFHSEIEGSHVSICTPAVDWRGAFDYKGLAQAADALFVMGYDYHWSGGDPGPVAPLFGGSPWGIYSVDWTIQDYRQKLQPLGMEKVILGVPFYGYEWPTVDLSVPGEATGKAKAYTYSQCQARANNPDYGGRRWDSVSYTPYLLYDIGGPHQLWYDDAESLAYKFDYAIEEELGGIGIWALNYEGNYEDVWEEIRERFFYSTDDDSDDDVDDDALDDDTDDDSDNNSWIYDSSALKREDEEEILGACSCLF